MITTRFLPIIAMMISWSELWNLHIPIPFLLEWTFMHFAFLLKSFYWGTSPSCLSKEDRNLFEKTATRQAKGNALYLPFRAVAILMNSTLRKPSVMQFLGIAQVHATAHSNELFWGGGIVWDSSCTVYSCVICSLGKRLFFNQHIYMP